MTDFLQQYAPASWWFGGLLGTSLFVFIIWLGAKIRLEWIKGRFARQVHKQVDHFNPLDSEFQKLRMNIHHLSNPVGRRIEGKRFIDCELIGPANIIIYQNCRIDSVGFIGCDVVVGAPKATINNVVSLKDVVIFGGAIYRATVFIHPDMVKKFRKSNMNFVTLTGDPEIDSQLQ